MKANIVRVSTVRNASSPGRQTAASPRARAHCDKGIASHANSHHGGPDEGDLAAASRRSGRSRRPSKFPTGSDAGWHVHNCAPACSAFRSERGCGGPRGPHRGWRHDRCSLHILQTTLLHRVIWSQPHVCQPGLRSGAGAGRKEEPACRKPFNGPFITTARAPSEGPAVRSSESPASSRMSSIQDKARTERETSGRPDGPDGEDAAVRGRKEARPPAPSSQDEKTQPAPVSWGQRIRQHPYLRESDRDRAHRVAGGGFRLVAACAQL